MVARDVIEGNCIFILLIKDNIVRIRLHLKVSRLHDGTIIVLLSKWQEEYSAVRLFTDFCHKLVVMLFYLNIFFLGGGGYFMKMTIALVVIP